MDDLVLYRRGTPIGIIAPSVLFGRNRHGVYFNGPHGIVLLGTEDEPGLQDALSSNGSLVPGTPEEITKIQALLGDPVTSRTASYLLCGAQCCADVIQDLDDLARSTVVIAGCGGIGSAVALLLAGSGIKKFRLIDPDVVEKSNLNRQLFWTLQDLGEFKAETLAKVLKARFEGLALEIQSAETSIVQLCELCASDVDALVVTADNPGTLASQARRITDECGVPVISGGYMHDSMIIFTFMPHSFARINDAHGACPIDWQRLPSSIMPSYGPMNMALAAQISDRVIRSIAYRSFGRPETSVSQWKMEDLCKVV